MIYAGIGWLLIGCIIGTLATFVCLRILLKGVISDIRAVSNYIYFSCKCLPSDSPMREQVNKVRDKLTEIARYE